MGRKRTDGSFRHRRHSPTTTGRHDPRCDIKGRSGPLRPPGGRNEGRNPGRYCNTLRRVVSQRTPHQVACVRQVPE
eukprot:2930676-Prymnesium_polylepis.1